VPHSTDRESRRVGRESVAARAVPRRRASRHRDVRCARTFRLGRWRIDVRYARTFRVGLRCIGGRCARTFRVGLLRHARTRAFPARPDGRRMPGATRRTADSRRSARSDGRRRCTGLTPCRSPRRKACSAPEGAGTAREPACRTRPTVNRAVSAVSRSPRARLRVAALRGAATFAARGPSASVCGDTRARVRSRRGPTDGGCPAGCATRWPVGQHRRLRREPETTAVDSCRFRITGPRATGSGRGGRRGFQRRGRICGIFALDRAGSA
jgi:hypothetical protein